MVFSSSLPSVQEPTLEFVCTCTCWEVRKQGEVEALGPAGQVRYLCSNVILVFVLHVTMAHGHSIKIREQLVHSVNAPAQFSTCSDCCKATPPPKFKLGDEIRTRFWTHKDFKRVRSDDSVMANVIKVTKTDSVRVRLISWPDSTLFNATAGRLKLQEMTGFTKVIASSV